MAHSEQLIAELEDMRVRLLKHCLSEFSHASQGHAGGTLSALDLVTALYFHHLKFDANNPDWPERDRLVMSKAHACEAVYAALVELGIYPADLLSKYYCFGSPFQGHADRWCTKAVDFSGGSLGQGLSFAAGLALAEKMHVRLDPPERVETFMPRYIVRVNPTYRTYCILGDGELNEGQNWEAAMFAAKYRLDNLVAIVDYNKWCVSGPTNDIMPVEPLVDKWKAFGWWVTEIDGHDFRQICDALDLTSSMYGDNQPKVIIAHTVKGRGIPTWEDQHIHLGRGKEIATGVTEGRDRYGDFQ